MVAGLMLMAVMLALVTVMVAAGEVLPVSAAVMVALP